MVEFTFIWRLEDFCLLLGGIMKWDFVLRLTWIDSMRNYSRRGASQDRDTGVRSGILARRRAMALAVVSL
jgi:hypothetical protein